MTQHFLLLGGAVVFVLAVLYFVLPSVDYSLQEQKEIEKVLTSMPARSIIVMKDGTCILASRVASDDKPHLLDVLYIPGGEWKRVEFDEMLRRKIRYIRVRFNTPEYAWAAAKFVRKQ